MSPAELTERLGWCSCPRRYLNCRFENFNAYNSALKDRLALVSLAATQGRSVFLFGTVGSGKTHLAVSAMANWVARRAIGQFISSIEFASKVQSAFGNAVEVVNSIMNHTEHFILIDDFAGGKLTENVASALFCLIDRIYRDPLRFIATSNLTLADIEKFEPRIASRLLEIALPIEMRDVEDYRLRKAEDRKRVVST